jgi:hypothetical protein
MLERIYSGVRLGKGIPIHEESLSDYHTCAEKQRGFLQLDECQEMHSLIFCLLQKGIDPAII